LNKNSWMVLSFLLALLVLFPSVSAEAATSVSSSEVTSLSSAPNVITYSREFHRSSGFTKTKFYRHTRYQRSYVGYLTFVRTTSNDYALYEGKLYLEGGNYPIPSRFEPIEI